MYKINYSFIVIIIIQILQIFIQTTIVVLFVIEICLAYQTTPAIGIDCHYFASPSSLIRFHFRSFESKIF